MRLDLVLRNRTAYSYEGYTSRQVIEALEKKEIPFKTIYLSDGVLNEYIPYLRENPPVSIICFSNLFHYDRPLCDIIRIPQFFWTMHTFSEAAHFLDSEFGKIGLPYPCSLPNTVFLPHGSESAPQQEKIFDTVLFSPLVDLDDLEKKWDDLFPKEVNVLVKKAIETDEPSLDAVKQVLQESAQPFSLSLLLHAVETYQKAKRAHETISSFEGGYLDVFGEHVGNNWLRRLPNAKWVRLHYKLPYTEHLEVLKQSKQVIIDPLEPHWYIPATAYGCQPLGYAPAEIQLQSWEKQTNQLVELLYES